MTTAPGLLADLGPEERRAVLARMHRRTFAAGEIVCHEGDLAETVHFVVEGRVVAWRASDSGDVHAYAVMGPGQTFGELAMIRRDGRRTATVEAIEPTVTMTLSFVEFERLCAAHPEVNRLLLRLLAARVARLTDALMEALHQPAEQRVVRRLAGLCDVYASRSPASSPVRDPVTVLVPLNQTDLAELAGVTRPTANRVLRHLEAEGVVELLRGRISVRDPDALRRLAGAGRQARHG
ncbi:Crp/Fnr family transcriptional regulator [Intrasporangium sp. YIM S08009]|uniref:Crp/Fnr family transcriptional regulator n=1 Tax=Intrasporangium zincisolvens TaxID=3080018 RepID=UPI002B06004A|nr:Crp/Fnr family transcriptional regulator [Intrasporangium sp. YIM S08009]